jgi:hypothetical protein
MVPSQSQIIHNFPSYFFNIHLNIIIQFIPKSSMFSLPFRFSDKNSVQIYYLPLHATYNTLNFQDCLPITEGHIIHLTLRI